MRIQRLFCALILSLSVFSVQAMNLPKGYKLLQNEQGQSYVTNKQDITMIEAEIIQLGYNNNWILGCIKNTSIDTEEKRFIFINLKWGGATDSVNRKNWEYFKGVYPDLAEIVLEPITDDTCP